MTNLIVDASIAVKWVIEQDNSEQAEALLSSSTSLLAPSLILAEVGNALWKYVRHDKIDATQACSFLGVINDGVDFMFQMKELYIEALEIAASLNHPVYDCFYLALARQQKAPLVTADKRLLRLCDKLNDIEAQSL